MFRSVGDELQTDEIFARDIIGQMSARFYDAVFVPAIVAARAEGKFYETSSVDCICVVARITSYVLPMP